MLYLVYIENIIHNRYLIPFKINGSIALLLFMASGQSAPRATSVPWSRGDLTAKDSPIFGNYAPKLLTLFKQSVYLT